MLILNRIGKCDLNNFKSSLVLVLATELGLGFSLNSLKILQIWLVEIGQNGLSWH